MFPFAVAVPVLDVAGAHALVVERLRHLAVVLVDAVRAEDVPRTHRPAEFQRAVGADRQQVVFEQRRQLVDIAGDVERRTPQHLAQIEVGVDRELDTLVAHRPDVAQDRGLARRGVHGLRVEQVVRVLQVNVGDHVDLAAQEAQVESGVVLVGGLPRQTVVAARRNGDAALAAVVDAAADQGLPAVVADSVLVTRAAVAGADLQVGLLGVPERLVRDVPADRHRGEPAPAGSRARSATNRRYGSWH